MEYSLFFSLYLVLAWPIFWVLWGRSFAAKSLLNSIFVAIMSLVGFFLGSYMLAQLLPTTLKLSLTPTPLVSTEGYIYGATVQTQPTFWHYLILSVPWVVLSIVAARLVIGSVLLSKRTGKCKYAPIKLQDDIEKVSQTAQTKTPRLLLTDGRIQAFSSLDKIFISKDMLVLPKNQLEAIFAHEIAHIKRRDILSKWLWMLTGSVAVLVPSKFIWHRFSVEMEKSADRHAVQIIGSPIPLAEALLGVARMSQTMPMMANLGDGGLLERTKALLEPEKTMKSRKSLVFALILSLSLLVTPALWPVIEVPHIQGLSEWQIQKLIEGKMIAVVRPAQNDHEKTQISFYPKEALKKDSFGRLYLDKRVNAGIL